MLRFRKMNPENFPSLIREGMTAKEKPKANSKLGGKTKKQAQSLTARGSAREPKLLIDNAVAD
jgi:hypothetical protein